ncbi:MAG: VOC family protein [Oscillospiraceae bacterium]|jgi:lactoylglutathione lyase|nr:VOC family protein [Oscillospiraceae bacterium]
MIENMENGRTIHLGSIYLVVRDFAKSIDFYEKLLQMPVSGKNMERFAMFEFDGQCISIMNGLFDAENPGKTIIKDGKDSETAQKMEADSLAVIANAPNTHKFVLNFWADDLRAEHARIAELGIGTNLNNVSYLFNTTPYYSFQLHDPDDNIIEICGAYTPEEGEFDE